MRRGNRTDVRRIPMFTTGERMKKARREAGIEIGQMLDDLELFDIHTTLQTIRSWETWRNQPRHLEHVLQAWAAICGVDYAWLISGYASRDSLAS